MYRLTKTWSIDCAHSLPQLPPEHKCARLHGHTYHVTIELQGDDLDELGMLLDYGELDKIVRLYDHRNWNDFVMPSTAERIAYHLAECVAGLEPVNFEVRYVRVSETPSTSAEYWPPR